METLKDTYSVKGLPPYPEEEDKTTGEKKKRSKSSGANSIRYRYNSIYGTKELEEKPRYRRLKRQMDLIICGLAAIILMPVFLIIALIIKLDSKGPVIYSQDRVGKGGRIFKIYKFRSMYVDTDKEKKNLQKKNQMDGPAFKMKYDPRVTRIGRILRSTSLDEFPQIINVLKGDMSIVGPRPTVIPEVLEYSPEYLRRLSVDQGLTCLWQIGGRNDTTFEEWMSLDLKYVEDRSLWLDIKIISKTVPAILLRKGAY